MRGGATKKIQLERILQSLEPIPRPTSTSEQIPTPPAIAAEVLWMALGHGDIADRSLADLGSGNGILAIGGKLLGASRVVAVESDPEAVDVARRNAARTQAEVEWRLGDVRGFRERVETIVMNPPFGAQRKRADRPFLDAAMASAPVVYTFLNPKSEGFVRRRIEGRGGRVAQRLEYRFPVPHLFPFHRDLRRDVPVLLYRCELRRAK